MKKSLTLLVACFSVVCASSAHAEGMKPGLWEFTTQTSGAGMPAMPAIPEAQRKQMEAMGIKIPQAGGGMGVTTKVCITPEQAKKGVPPNSDKDGEKCEQTDVKTSGKTTSWKMVCSGKHKMTGNGSVTYDSPEHFSGETTMNMQDGPQGAMTMNNKFSGTFVAANCKQGR
ncbi:conserved exported protein of unknown function [Georgfuchsia toluolica]|uniref:DUF3617 domain-containing protein n=1 Tax=Georgfuchsia toluolica TaxID=424218 RepID=A0A916J5A1_9PROT|nr:DUF3617 domain-containing protein [Georgfuchsia toluolica]CAG4884221.1 conserved exported protein of unknown function [Georgfuchsia toluolica]